jgi:hypothetical protein
VTLSQTGYYNPRAAEGEKFREYLVEGVDYKNSDIKWSDIAGQLGLSAVDAPSGDYTDSTYMRFEQLNSNQQKVVLASSGYMPLFSFSYTDAQVHRAYNGVASVTPWTPSWAGKSTVIYRVDVDGWRDRYISMPEGAQDDVLRVVSQGVPQYLNGDTTLDGNEDGSWGSGSGTGELVAQYKEEANVSYVQKYSDFSVASNVPEAGNRYTIVNGNTIPSDADKTKFVYADTDKQNDRWTVSYADGGKFSIQEVGRTEAVSLDQTPG